MYFSIVGGLEYKFVLDNLAAMNLYPTARWNFWYIFLISSSVAFFFSLRSLAFSERQ